MRGRRAVLIGMKAECALPSLLFECGVCRAVVGAQVAEGEVGDSLP